jgi:hypothetical protein
LLKPSMNSAISSAVTGPLQSKYQREKTPYKTGTKIHIFQTIQNSCGLKRIND